MIYGYLICAGNQSRFNSILPKSLQVLSNGETVLDYNIKFLERVCDEVIVVCAASNFAYFSKYNKIVIESGLGSGDAVYKAIGEHTGESDYCFIQWGDSMISSSELFNYINLSSNDYVQLPCKLEDHPYVEIVDKDNFKISVNFTKYGYASRYGYHDMSIFYSNSSYLYGYLSEFKDTFFYNNQYNTPFKEFEFLDLFNATEIKAKIIDMSTTNIEACSFNTVEEFLSIKEKNFYED